MRWRYGTPPVGNANFGWLQHIVHHLSPTGTAGVVLANGSMSSQQSGEGEIRKALVEADYAEPGERTKQNWVGRTTATFEEEVYLVPPTPEALLQRYNLALAQAALAAFPTRWALAPRASALCVAAEGGGVAGFDSASLARLWLRADLEEAEPTAAGEVFVVEGDVDEEPAGYSLLALDAEAGESLGDRRPPGSSRRGPGTRRLGLLWRHGGSEWTGAAARRVRALRRRAPCVRRSRAGLPAAAAHGHHDDPGDPRRG